MEEKKGLDVLNHQLVPKMEILSDSQKKKVLEEYSVTEDRLPKMKHTDPVAVALEAEVGDIIKITRKDPTGKYFYYRLVV